jgi:hypothetical protein
MASKNKLLPNYCWVQNSSNLSTIRDTLELVDEYGIKHLELREKIKEFRDKANDLPRRWTWDARCRIKGIHACGLVKLDRTIQGYTLTDIGKKLIKAPKSDKYFKGKRLLTLEEIEIFRKGLLTNVPVNRVLNLFKEDMLTQNQGLTKYDIGEKLGFVGDEGFTHFNPVWIVANDFNFNDKEGDADKWARTILSWLRQVNFIDLTDKRIIGTKKLVAYKGKEIINRVLRYDAKRIIRNVPSEMLCSNHHPFPKTVQYRRSRLLELLHQERTVDQLKQALQGFDIAIDEKMVRYEIINLTQVGFNIKNDGLLYKLEDRINLDINSNLIASKNETVNDIEKEIEDAVIKYSLTIPPRLVDNLIRYGNDGTKGNEFESIVADYFTFLGYETTYLGQGHGRVADVIVKYKDQNYQNSYALIIDAKATNNVYSFPASDVRKMKEYISAHGIELLHDLVPKHSFSFVSSDFIKIPNTKLKEIADETSVNGCCIDVKTLLELAHTVSSGAVNISTLYANYTTNEKFEFIS